jgi:hypothetical protein
MFHSRLWFAYNAVDADKRKQAHKKNEIIFPFILVFMRGTPKKNKQQKQFNHFSDGISVFLKGGEMRKKILIRIFAREENFPNVLSICLCFYGIIFKF